MKKLKTKFFGKWQNKTDLTDKDLNNAIKNLVESKSAPGIGKFLFKVRVAREDSGKSGGYRTIIVFRKGEIALFAYGFGKSEKDNLAKDELKYWKQFAKDICGLDQNQVRKAIDKGEFFELEEIKNA